MIKKYNGIIVPMLTPVTKERKLDEPSLVRICQYLAKHDLSILLLGTTGESPSISSEVSRRVVRITANAVAGKVKLYAGISGNCIGENIENAKQYIKSGVDVIVSILPN